MLFQLIRCILLSFTFLIFIPASAQAQRYAPGDTIHTSRPSRLYDEPDGFASRGRVVPRNRTLVVQEIAKEGDYVRVEYKGETGWLRWIHIQDIATARAEEKKRMDRIRAEIARRDSLREAREERMRELNNEGVNLPSLGLRGWVILAICLQAIGFGVLSTLSASKKNRNIAGWFFIGLVFGLFGFAASLIVEKVEDV